MTYFISLNRLNEVIYLQQYIFLLFFLSGMQFTTKDSDNDQRLEIVPRA